MVEIKQEPSEVERDGACFSREAVPQHTNAETRAPFIKREPDIDVTDAAVQESSGRAVPWLQVWTEVSHEHNENTHNPVSMETVPEGRVARVHTAVATLTLESYVEAKTQCTPSESLTHAAQEYVAAERKQKPEITNSSRTSRSTPTRISKEPEDSDGDVIMVDKEEALASGTFKVRNTTCIIDENQQPPCKPDPEETSDKLNVNDIQSHLDRSAVPSDTTSRAGGLIENVDMNGADKVAFQQFDEDGETVLPSLSPNDEQHVTVQDVLNKQVGTGHRDRIPIFEDDEAWHEINDEKSKLEIELNALERKSTRRPLSKEESHQLQQVTTEIADLDKKLEEMVGSVVKYEPQPEARLDIEAPKKRQISQKTTKKGRPPPSNVHDTSQRKRKRASNKNAKGGAKKARVGRNSAVSTTQADRIQPKGQASRWITNMLTLNENPLRQGGKTKNGPNIGPITANTVADQIKQIKDQLANQPEVDMTRVRADEKSLTQARVAFGSKRCLARDGNWLIKGMSTPLYSHQVIGAGWMITRERSRAYVYNSDEDPGPARAIGPVLGGILADTMGMGKTIETLACIWGNQPSKNEKTNARGATLIVCPANLVKQWFLETEKHCGEGSLKTYIYKSSQNPPYSATGLAGYDVIFVSYIDLARNYCPPKESEEPLEQKCKLFDVNFYRIVLDEAHMIKDISTKTTQACLALKGKCRWLLTGTPTLNSVWELFPYMKFLHTDFPNTLSKFKSMFKHDESEELEEWSLYQTLRQIMLMRSGQATLFSQPLLKLPDANHLDPIQVAFLPEESHIHSFILDRYRNLLGKVLGTDAESDKTKSEEGGAEEGEHADKKKITVLQAIQQVREGTAHLFLLENRMPDLFPLEVIRNLKKTMPDKSAPTPFLDAMERFWLKSWVESKPPNDEQLEQSSTPKCSICWHLPVQAYKTECDHLFCKLCLGERLESQREKDHTPLACPRCRQPIADPKPYDIISSQQHNTSTQNSKERKANGAIKKSRKSVWDDWNGVRLKDAKTKSIFLELFEDPSIPLPLSAKTIAVKNYISQCQKEAPGDKIIVFTQWVTFGEIIGRVLRDAGIPYLYLFGEMSQDKKSRAIDVFENDPEVKVLIASFRCSGQGLNLTCANRVILVDLWWNYSMEYQAFGRVYRIGQQKQTYFVRVLVKDSIDRNIHIMQERKLAEIERTNQEFNPKEQLLTRDQMKLLFDRDITEDENGEWSMPTEDDESDCPTVIMLIRG